MALDTNTDRGREVVSYVRVGRGMVKVTKYENEQPKSPSDTASVRSGSSSGRSASTSGTATRGHGWLRRPRAKRSSKRTPSSHRHRSRSRSSVRSLHTIRRPSGYMRPEHDVSSSSNEHCSRNAPVLPDRRGRFESQGLFALDSLPVPGSLQPEEPSYDKDSNYPKSTPPSLIERGHRRGIHISPPLGTSPGQATSPPSPSPLSWATGYEIDSTADAEMWSHITRLEDELVSRFGRGAVPQLSSLRNEKSSAPPTVGTRGKRDLSPALPDELVAALQRDPPSTLRPGEKLKQRSFEPINLAEPPRRVHRAKSSPTLAFPLPPPTIPDWVNSMPLPAPPAELAQGITPSPTMMRAKAGPLPPFAPPPNFPPPPPPNTRTRELDATEDSEAIEALYRVLLQRAENRRAGIGKPGGGAPRPGESGRRRKDLRLGELGPGEAGKPIILEPTKGTLSEHDEGNRTPSASTTNII
ncbi:hypothetical protein RSOLAG1IB_07560 [Rhizoctonia solani AG-1 IB]|uniref:Uncharacterized protein n=1 Tax=Thanatephorus cucumeris (strain AG1-IB / isolate 7/3/14) TaxID=1108050 RepID=A0A0B7FIZ8_THACB|nr:hypothetical protein RSOLAG1IB_07560 [Rhizoctonia solani AG-1 IB]